MGIEIGLMAASLAVSAASAMGQSRQSKGMAAYQNAQQKAAYEKTLAVSRAQGAVTAAERRRQIQSRYDAYRGATAVSAAERGVSSSRTTQALMSSLGIQASRESAKVSLEEALNQQSFAISNMPQWQVGQSTSPILAGIQGGLQGLSMGIGIRQSQQSLDIAKATAAAQGIQLPP